MSCRLALSIAITALLHSGCGGLTAAIYYRHETGNGVCRGGELDAALDSWGDAHNLDWEGEVESTPPKHRRALVSFPPTGLPRRSGGLYVQLMYRQSARTYQLELVMVVVNFMGDRERHRYAQAYGMSDLWRLLLASCHPLREG